MGQPRLGEGTLRETVLPFMVDRLRTLKLSLNLLNQAKAGPRRQDACTSAPLSVPAHHSRPPLHLLRRMQRQRLRTQAPSAGFTLVELLIVVVILGMLSGVAMPAFLGQQNKARVNAANIPGPWADVLLSCPFYRSWGDARL